MESYHNIKEKIEEINEKKIEGARIRGKCLWYELWYEEGEKSLKFILNLEKCRGIEGQIRKLIVNNQEITNQSKYQNEFLFFYKTLFRNTSANTSEDCERFLNEVSVPKLNYEDARICEVIKMNLNCCKLLSPCKTINLQEMTD